MITGAPSTLVGYLALHRFGWAGPWVGVAALWIWSGGTTPWPLLVAAGALAITLITAGQERGRSWSLGVVLVVTGILVGLHAERQVNDVLTDWDGYWAGRVETVGELLRVELEEYRMDAGASAVDELIADWTATETAPTPEYLGDLREQNRISAAALYDASGALVAWDGVHRGKVPEDVQSGDWRWSYRELPLFGYFYVTAKADDGSVAVVAYVLRASLPEGLNAEVRNLVTRFYAESGEQIRISEEDPGGTQVGWDFDLDGDRLLTVVLVQPEPQERAAGIRYDWALTVGFLALAAWLLFVIGGPLGRAEAIGAALALVAGAIWIPVDSVPMAFAVFDATAYRLPGPWGLSAGRVAMIGVVLFALVPVLPRPRFGLSPVTAAALAAALGPGILLWLHGGMTPDFLAGGRAEWVALQVAVTSLLALVMGVSISWVRGGRGSSITMFGAIAVAAAFAAAVGATVVFQGTSSIWWSVAFSIPVGLAAHGVSGWSGWQRSVAGWSIAIGIASCATIPIMWGQSIDARLKAGAVRLNRITAVEDLELEDRLFDFAGLADSLDAGGAEDVTILYEAWRLSGLSALGYPVRLQVELRDGSPGEGIRIGVAEGEPQPYQSIVAEGRVAGGVRLVQLDHDAAHYILTSALPDDRMVVAVVPPFPETSGRAGLGPLVRGPAGADLQALSVLPLPDGLSVPTGIGRSRTREGWQTDTGVQFSNGPAYHVIYAVDLPGVPLRIARAVLLIALNLTLFLGLLLVGRALHRDPDRAAVRFSGFAISFRARVTLALFGFFALASAVFGTVAYQTLSQASRRSAQVIAERVVDDAAGWYGALDGQMARLASQVGAELLEYRNGELVEGSLEELVELGLYEGWTPFAVHQVLDGYDAIKELHETSVGRWRYVTAYRRLRDGDVLAAQVPLQAGTSALQTTDLLEFLLFVIMLGGALSLGLAMVAGRALTLPIQALQIASESVGSGDLGLRLPAHRQDEFGAVFRAFNRMVGRVRRARRQLVRTSRRTQLIMDEAAVGMVALDPTGRVTLVNPRAEELLGIEVFVGRNLPFRGALGEPLNDWLENYLAGTADEGNSDFQVGERRVRVRVRRLGGFGTRRGVVVSLDDVTDELKAERVLAWGEMARQVAHEVKNPLTPIKLSIQHVKRAWDDGHPDFEKILIKNADAMLAEIDHLAEIAQSFSRFGAPSDQAAPLAPISVEDAVGEVMALYGSSAARVRFEQDVDRSLQPVVARTAELKEVLVNLLENARLAGTEGTRVTISAHQGEDASAVVLVVTDDGSGISENVLPRIFEPQFSTRSKGAGLGLAIVQRVVTAWGGSISVESELGVGTTVTVTLRVWETPEEA